MTFTQALTAAGFGLALASTAVLQGCVAIVGGGAAAGAAVAYDRRTTGTLIDDEIIELKAIDALSQDQEIWDQAHVNITSINNIVLVTGEAPSEVLRKRVADLVSAIPKVRSVHNEMAIAAPSSLLSRSSDALVTTKAKTAMLQHGTNLAGRTKVVTENGVIYLMGLMTRAEGEAATEIARRTGGVQRVVKVFEYLD